MRFSDRCWDDRPVDSLRRQRETGCRSRRGWTGYNPFDYFFVSNSTRPGFEDSKGVGIQLKPPVYKTILIVRFQAVIEREWIAAGHPFHTRCSHAAFAQGTLTGPFEAPVFLCFLDCVWQ